MSINEKDVKKLIKESSRSLSSAISKKIDEHLESKIITPFMNRLNKISNSIKELEIVIEGKNDNSGFSFDLIDPAINLFPLHVVTTMRFTMMVNTMVDQKKEPEEITNKIVDEYGETGKELVANLIKAVKSTRKKRLKDTCEEIKKLLEKNI